MISVGLVLTLYLRHLSFYISVEVSVNESISIRSISLALNKASKIALSSLESNLEHADTCETQHCFLPCRPLQRGLKMSQSTSKP